MGQDYSQFLTLQLGAYKNFNCYPGTNIDYNLVTNLTYSYTLPGWTATDKKIICHFDKTQPSIVASTIAAYSSALGYASTQLWIWGGWSTGSVLPNLLPTICMLKLTTNGACSSVTTEHPLPVDDGDEVVFNEVITTFDGGVSSKGSLINGWIATIANLAINVGVTDLYDRSVAATLVSSCVSNGGSNCDFSTLSGLSISTKGSCTDGDCQ